MPAIFDRLDPGDSFSLFADGQRNDLRLQTTKTRKQKQNQRKSNPIVILHFGFDAAGLTVTVTSKKKWFCCLKLLRFSEVCERFLSI